MNPNVFSLRALFPLCPQKLWHSWHARCSKQLAVLSPDLVTTTENVPLEAVSTESLGGAQSMQSLRHHQTVCHGAESQAPSLYA